MAACRCLCGQLGEICVFLGGIAAGGWLLGGRACLARAIAAEQGVEFACDDVAVVQQILHEAACVSIFHGPGDPEQIFVASRQDVGLLVIQVLDAVLYAAQKNISLRKGLRHWRAHETRTGQLRQGIKRCANPQFRELAAAHHLQQLHDEFDFAYAATRDLDVIGPFGPARAAGDGMVADLVVQHPQ